MSNHVTHEEAEACADRFDKLETDSPVSPPLHRAGEEDGGGGRGGEALVAANEDGAIICGRSGGGAGVAMTLQVHTARLGIRDPDYLDVSLQGNMRREEAGGHRGIGLFFAPPRISSTRFCRSGSIEGPTPTTGRSTPRAT